MLTFEGLQKIADGEVFASGTVSDNPVGVNMANTGELLRWVAKKGMGYHDWCIYIHRAENDMEYIKRHGDKVTNEANIKKLVPCDEETYQRYRF